MAAAGPAADARPEPVVLWSEEVKPQKWRQRMGYFDYALDEADKDTLSVATWNCSAVNNNPFEYWVEIDEVPEYTTLMTGVDAALEDPKMDVAVRTVFTDAMFADLRTALKKAGIAEEDLGAVDNVWRNDLCKRTLVTGFLRDRVLGKKRLISMPDRVSNTIRTAGGCRMLRPCVINASVGAELEVADQWWREWLVFLFDKEVVLPGKNGEPSRRTESVFELFAPINRDKYPAITVEEAAVSKPLQALYLAVFDAVLLHLVHTVGPDSWLGVKRKLCAALVDGKEMRQVAVLDDMYSLMDVLCLQEVSAAMIDLIRARLGERFHVVLGEEASAERNQNSAILLRKATFVSPGREVTAEATSRMVHAKSLAAGDLLVVHATSVCGADFVVTSFHGDSDGKLTIPVVTAVAEMAATVYPHACFVTGLDANTATPELAAMSQRLSWGAFLDVLPTLGLTTTSGDRPPPSDYTTFAARTSLQGQLQKAVPFADVSKLAAREPKDVILYRPTELLRRKCWKDCVGDGSWRDGAIMPSVNFPSDHAIVAAQLIRHS